MEVAWLDSKRKTLWEVTLEQILETGYGALKGKERVWLLGINMWLSGEKSFSLREDQGQRHKP